MKEKYLKKKCDIVLYTRKEECCGCSACYAICPQNAISMNEDEEGFEYPKINEDFCISCRKCLSVCPIRDSKRQKNEVEEFRMNCVFCFDNKMFEPACVAIASLLDSKNPREHFDMFCIVDNESLTRKSELEAIVNRRDEESVIHVLETPNDFEGAYEVRGISRATYTRFLIHRILPQIDKILYSDVDVLFCGSIRGLWETDISDAYFAAVKGTNNFTNKWEKYKEFDYYNELSGLKGQYVNAGIMLMNLACIRESGIENEWLERAKRKYEYQDQDILNITCKDRIVYLPLKYNLAAYLIPKWFKQYYTQGIYCQEEARDAQKKPVILHYAGEKPWDIREAYRGDEWWHYVLSQKDLVARFSVKRTNYVKKTVSYAKRVLK